MLIVKQISSFLQLLRISTKYCIALQFLLMHKILVWITNKFNQSEVY